MSQTPVQQNAPAAPVPVPAAPGTEPAMPAYGTTAPLRTSPDTRSPQSAAPTGAAPSEPVAIQAPQPVVAPAQTTPQSPYGAMPAYAPQKPYVPYGVPDEDRKPSHESSVYIPVDSWIYPAMTRLYALGYVPTEFLSMRPWTRLSVLHMLNQSDDQIRESDDEQAKEILVALERELSDEVPDAEGSRGTVSGVHTLYDRALGITGISLRDSYHLGQTIVNDYGRPYEPGFNNIAGFSTIEERGRFSFYFRGEYQHSPGAAGYSEALSAQLSNDDLIPFTGYNLHQDTIPTGPIPAVNPFRIEEASLSFHLAGHEISGGKTDAWEGPAQGGAMAWSNNAEDIYSFRIDRVEPLHIPLLSYLLGPVRYSFFYGSLKGHTDPNNDYVHSEMFSFAPSSNFQFSFERAIIFGGEGHEPVTLHTFLKGFFSTNDTDPTLKFSRDDPGARYSDFSASYRLPFVRKYATFYVDSIAHDDVSPISAPRRAAYRTGIDLSQVPGARRFELRVEAVSTDPGVSPATGGAFEYYEVVQLQGYTNKGFIMGDWIGREAKGGDAWLTYHFSGEEWLQLSYLNKKTPFNFIPGPQNPVTNNDNGPGGTTQNQFKLQLVKRFDHDNLELNAWFQYEQWKAPIYLRGQQKDTATAVQVTYYPGLHKFH